MKVFEVDQEQDQIHGQRPTQLKKRTRHQMFQCTRESEVHPQAGIWIVVRKERSPRGDGEVYPTNTAMQAFGTMETPIAIGLARDVMIRDTPAEKMTIVIGLHENVTKIAAD